MLFLDCPLEECSNRIGFRSLSSGRVDDNEASLLKRFNTFKKETIPNIEDNLSKITKIIRIDSNRSSEIVFDDICQEFDKL